MAKWKWGFIKPKEQTELQFKFVYSQIMEYAGHSLLVRDPFCMIVINSGHQLMSLSTKISHKGYPRVYRFFAKYYLSLRTIFQRGQPSN